MTLRANLTPDVLINTPDAFFAYLIALGPDDACDWLRFASTRMPTADWLDQCLGAALNAEHEGAPTLEAIARLLGRTIVAERQVEPLREVLKQLLKLRSMRTVLPEVAAWLATRAGPGDAAIVAEWLNARDTGIPDQTRYALELRLLERGFAELRRAENAALMVRIVLDVDREFPDRRELALRTLLQCEPALDLSRADGNVFRGSGPVLADIGPLLAVAERVLARDGDPSLACDLATLAGWGTTCQQAFRNRELDRVSAALIAQIADASERIDRSHGVSVCLQELFDSHHELPPLRSPRAIGDAIRFACNGRWGASRSGRNPERLDRWTETVVRSWFEVYGLCRGDNEGLSQLEIIDALRLVDLIEHDDLHAPTRRALEETLARRDDVSARPIRAILDAHPDDPRAVVPAVWALPPRDPRRSLKATTVGPSRDDLAANLAEVFIRSWTKSVCGVRVAELLRGAHTIDITELKEERKYEIRDHKLLVDEESVMGMVAGLAPDEGLASACLYLAHEIVHGAQNLDDKAMVEALRDTGGETTLAHLDLAADHAAIRIVHEARRTWSIEWLQDLYCIANRKFPIKKDHIAAARARKLGRTLALRTDYLLRREKLVPIEQLGDGYAFVEMGPGGGKLVVLSSQPPITVLGATALDEKDAELLARASDQKAPPLAEIDRTLVRVLTEACRPRA